MRSSLDEIAVFVAVVDQGSFRAAADRLGLSPSAVSKRVSALEERLGIQLLQRTTRSLTITQAGELLYDQVRTIPTDIAEAEEQLRESAGRVTGDLRVVMPTFFESDVLYERVVPAYLDAFPEVSLTLTIVHDPVSQLQGTFDLLVAGRLPHHQFPDSSAVGRQLLKLRGALFASPDYLQRHGRPQHPRDLAGRNCLSYLNPEWHFTSPSGQPIIHRAEGDLRTNSNQLLRVATLAGRGIAYSFPVFFRDALRAGQVETLLDEYTAESYVGLHVFYPAARFIPRRTRAFVDILVDHLSSEPRQ